MNDDQHPNAGSEDATPEIAAADDTAFARLQAATRRTTPPRT